MPSHARRNRREPLCVSLLVLPDAAVGTVAGMLERTFKRRFSRATGHSPVEYVQRVRVGEAKRRLERTSEPVDAISYAVGYEDPASFRRLFERVTGVTPGAYRRKLQVPAFARDPLTP